VLCEGLLEERFEMHLLICAPAPVNIVSGELKLDTKFVDGMHAHVRDWGGPVRCILWQSTHDIHFGKAYDQSKLPFELLVLEPNAPIPPFAFEGVSVAMLSADMPGIHLMANQAIAADVPFIVALEYTLSTRLRILWLDKDRSASARLRTLVWILRHEHRMRTCLKKATGVQFNGYPAFDIYSKLNNNSLLYLDNRMARDMLATLEEMAARAERLRSGAPLRLIHSGRLEYMKGTQDLPELMRVLRELRVDATLDVYGAGSLAETLRKGFAPFGESVKLHGPVDFQTELVPINRTGADVFVSCHRQQDPSCTYLEAMGCGLAVVGYANQMWSRLKQASGAGKVAPLGDVAALAKCIAELDQDRGSLIKSCQAGLEFASMHDFSKEFRKRIEHARASAID
jgi:glycosyltransferase involved in cell wall biosynthesis